MTLRELRERLLEKGAREIARSKRTNFGQKPLVTIYFTTDKQVVFPRKLENVGSIILATSEETQKVNTEQYKALLRHLKLA